MGELQHIPLKLNLPINTDTLDRKIQEWDAQTRVATNSGIYRNGGVTNLHQRFESGSLYAETFYGKNGTRIRLKYDSVNDNFRVITGERDIGQVPSWAVRRRALILADANDVLVTTTGTLLILRISSGVATIEEVDRLTYERINIKTFSVGAGRTDGFLVRNKAPTFANVTSIVAIGAAGLLFYHAIVLDSGTVYTASGQTGFTNASQVFAYYENGWIVAAQQETGPQVFLFRSTGAQDGTFTAAAWVTANHNRSSGAVTFNAWRLPSGAPYSTYGYTFTPPAAAGSAWTVTSLTDAAITALPPDYRWTFGGFALTRGSPQYLAFYNQATPRTWVFVNGKTSDIYGWLDTGAAMAVKIHTILGMGSYFSAAWTPDGIGAPITEIGEINANYYPQIIADTDGDYHVIYRRGDGAYGIVEMSKDTDIRRMQEIAPGVVKINTISALCVADANDNDLQYGGNAYNGFAVLEFASSPAVATAYVARYLGEYGEGVDPNYIDVGSVGPVMSIAIPENANYSPNNESIDVFIGAPPASLTYSRSVSSGGSLAIRGDMIGMLYVQDTRIPPPGGAAIDEQTIRLLKSIAIREPAFDGYAIGNEVAGSYDSFRLFGNLYLFDGEYIHLATLAANTIQRVDHIADATGLQFLCETPSAAIFLSTYDNALFTFDGGQSVTKFMVLSDKDAIVAAAWNTRENALVLLAGLTAIFIRDGIVTQTSLPFVPVTAAIFSTSDGVWLSSLDGYAVLYLYDPDIAGVPIVDGTLDGGSWGTSYADTVDGGSWGTYYDDAIDGAAWGSGGVSVVALYWSSEASGFSPRMTQKLERVLLRFFSPDLSEVELEIAIGHDTEDGVQWQTGTITLGGSEHPWDALGYAYVELVSGRRCISASVGIYTPDRVVLLEAVASVAPEGLSTVAYRI